MGKCISEIVHQDDDLRKVFLEKIFFILERRGRIIIICQNCKMYLSKLQNEFGEIMYQDDDLNKSVAAVDLLRIGMERGDNQTDVWTHTSIFFQLNKFKNLLSDRSLNTQ